MIIGISGYIGTGKSVVARHLSERHGFTVLPLADALKQEVLKRFPLTLAAILAIPRPFDKQGKIVVESSEMRRAVYVEKPPGIRELLQEYGTDVRRADDPEYWVKRWLVTYGSLGKPHVVVPDVRFPNEARMVTELGGYLIRVLRPGHGAPASRHASEQEPSWRVHALIDNDGTLEDLADTVDRLLLRWPPTPPSAS